MPQEPRFGTEQLSKYPHMFPRDAEIWDRFLERYGFYYSGFDYDVKVGSGRDYSQEPDETLRRGAFINSKKRIDAVGYQNDAITIFEVKPQASSAAIGQAISYATLYTKEFNPEKKVVPAIVTDFKVPDTRLLTREFNILYFKV